MNTSQTNQNKVVSYNTLRFAIGLIGVLLPIILSAGLYFIEGAGIQPSISNYYHTIMRNFFVGAVCAVAFFLYAYKGFNPEDTIISRIAAFSVLGVAFFPMEPCPEDTLMICSPKFIISACSSNTIHFLSAATFFLMLSYFSIFLFTKTQAEQDIIGIDLLKRKSARASSPSILSDSQGKGKKLERWLHRICGIIIALSLVLIAICMFLEKDHSKIINSLNPTFWLESIALWAFGISWLVKGAQSHSKHKSRSTNSHVD